ncbi:hypothetical protein F5146DRAFT_1105114 [Armillaria mellea]|nr:hypothetical protein F5146DRAFT_1105114 [Armillaria mellea]
MLVIGIDKYKELKHLHGAIANVTLYNEEVMRVTIETEIKNLASNTYIRKDDPILIFYAGHGSEAPTSSRWTSPNGKIQMLAPYNFNPNVSSKEGRGILDITLSHLLRALTKEKSDNITYTIAQDMLHDTENAYGTEVPEKYEKANELSHVLLSACKQGEEAVERDGHGTFTSAWLDLLQEKSVDKLTYEDIMAKLSLPKQELQCEGVHRSQFLFNSKGQYTLEAGEAHGITKNDKLIVFADKTMRSHLGTVVAVKTDDFTTMCHSFTGQVFHLFIEPNEKLGTFKQIADEMENNKAGKRGLYLMENCNDADLVVATDGLTHMPFRIKLNDSDAICRMLQSSTDFYCKNSPLTEKVKLECMKLTETGKYMYDLEDILEPDLKGINLNDNDVISIDISKKAIYGYKITNILNVPFYVSMFYFNISDLSISSYYQPGSMQKDVNVSLSGKKSLAIRYSMSETVPHTYTLREGQVIDVGFLKDFLLRKHIDLLGIIQKSPFDSSHATNDAEPKVSRGWLMTNVAIVQK